MSKILKSIFLLANIYLIINPSILINNMSNIKWLSKPTLIILPIILVSILILIANHFNKSHLTYIGTAFTICYLILYSNSNFLKSLNPKFKDDFFNLLIIYYSLITTYFYLSKEKNIFSLIGIFNLFITISIPPGVLIFLNKYGDILINFKKNYPYIFTTIPIINVKLFLLCTILICIGIIKGYNLEKKHPFPYIFNIIIFFSIIVSKKIELFSNIYFIAPFFIIMILAYFSSFYKQTWEDVYTDKLTGLLNRRALDENLSKLTGNYSVTMMDIDHFKKFNDTYGHQAGDEVLQFIGNHLKKIKFGKPFRYGGEEFSILSTGKNSNEIINDVENLRRTIESSSLILTKAKNPKYKGKRVNVTMSAGIASNSPFINDPIDVIKLADGALYRAKKKGRNRVEIEKRKTLR